MSKTRQKPLHCRIDETRRLTESRIAPDGVRATFRGGNPHYPEIEISVVSVYDGTLRLSLPPAEAETFVKEIQTAIVKVKQMARESLREFRKVPRG